MMLQMNAIDMQLCTKTSKALAKKQVCVNAGKKRTLFPVHLVLIKKYCGLQSAENKTFSKATLYFFCFWFCVLFPKVVKVYCIHESVDYLNGVIPTTLVNKLMVSEVLIFLVGHRLMSCNS